MGGNFQKIIFLVVLSQLFICILTENAATDVVQNPDNNSNTNNLRYLMEAGKIKYFADVTNKLTWDQADALCKSAGMTLAKLKSDHEASVLVSRFLTMEGEVWTSAKEHLFYKAFKWVDNSETIVNYWNWQWDKEIDPPYYCLTVQVGPKGPRVATVRPCTEFHGTLCQTLIP